MQERYYTFGDGPAAETMFVRHSALDPTRPSLFFIHGMGESGLSFVEAFGRPELRQFNLVAPDTMGYGRSSAAAGGDYSYDRLIERHSALATRLQLGPVVLVGHSMGGMLATYWASSDRAGDVRKVVNIEGNLTPADVTFSRLSVDAFEAGGRNPAVWHEWFRNEFMEKSILARFGPRWESCRRYYASLWFCRPEAFLANSQEMLTASQPSGGDSTCEIGRRYLSIRCPKLFCSGTESLAPATAEFLTQHQLPHRSYEGAFHWPMIESTDQFYRDLAEFVA